MLKDKQFWDNIEHIINEEYSDYIVIDLFFTIDTYMELTDDSLELPVNQRKFYNIYHECERRLPKLLSPNTLKYTIDLRSIVKEVAEKGVTCAVLKVLDFVKDNHEVNAVFCAMGVLKGIQEVTENPYNLVTLKLAMDGLFEIITSL